MDAHTLELLEFHKIRELVASYAYCSLGKDLALQAEPSTDADAIRAELALVSEMVEVLGQGQSPPFSGLTDVRLLSRRAAIGAMLTADQPAKRKRPRRCPSPRPKGNGRVIRRVPRRVARSCTALASSARRRPSRWHRLIRRWRNPSCRARRN